MHLEPSQNPQEKISAMWYYFQLRCRPATLPEIWLIADVFLQNLRRFWEQLAVLKKVCGRLLLKFIGPPVIESKFELSIKFIRYPWNVTGQGFDKPISGHCSHFILPKNSRKMWTWLLILYPLETPENLFFRQNLIRH